MKRRSSLDVLYFQGDSEQKTQCYSPNDQKNTLSAINYNDFTDELETSSEKYEDRYEELSELVYQSE